MVPRSMTAPWEIDVLTAARSREAGALLLDVREPDELALCALPGCTAIPLGEVPAGLARLPRDRDILVLCHHGSRSRLAVRFLREQGFDRASNVTGGIDAWARQVDPALPRY